MTIARVGSLVAHTVHGRLDQVPGLTRQLAESLDDFAADISRSTSLVIRVDLPVCGCAVLGLSYAEAASATSGAERAHAAQGVALSNALGASRTPPAMSLRPLELMSSQ